MCLFRSDTNYIDIQVNGYAGVDFSSLDLTSDSIDFCVKKLKENGTPYKINGE